MVSGSAKWLNDDAWIWLTQVLGAAPEHLQVVTGGKNNRGLRIKAATGDFFVKHYFDDDCRRFQRETGFLSVLQKHQITSVARLIAANDALLYSGKTTEMAVFSHLNGVLPEASALALEQDKWVQQVALFIAQINQASVQQDASMLLSARGGLSLASEFIREVERRKHSLLSLELTHVQTAELSLYQAMQSWLENAFEPILKHIEKQVIHDFGPLLHTPFQRVLSPSDIGFHNTLLDENTGKLHFFDFEYSGWDSAEKLVTDFFAQPRFEIDAKWLPLFTGIAFPEQFNLVTHCQRLLPLAHLKWVLIFLNEFKEMDDARRIFSSDQKAQAQTALIRKQEQMDKAKARLNLAASYVR